ncbi:MAG: hypothetical protein H6601_00170 [Flavobacteriales bacterium]|nr:hypothetical protein [Flavobacteriales bacterium]
MTQDQFHTWVDDPNSMGLDSIPHLREVIKRYPYFTLAQILLAKNLRSENHIDQLKQLQLAAVMSPDRKVLHDYLNDKRRQQQKSVAETVEVEENTTNIEEASNEGLAEEVTGLRFPDELIPEPIIYQLETAELPELPIREEQTPEPEELSFSEWLAFTETGKIDKQGSVPKPVTETEKRSKIELIDHFLTQADELPKKRAEFFNPRKVAAKADEGDFSVVSETLARIYFQQEKYELAKQAYESLMLKYPEKSTYFAARLKEIEEKLTSE